MLNRWSAAGRLDTLLPQIRGRDRILRLVRGQSPPRALRQNVEVWWGPGLTATINPSEDGSLAALYLMQWSDPALLPVLEECLEPGDFFVDVGANIGIYSTWAARLVGQSGRVVAIEPTPWTRRVLEQLCARNDLQNVDILPWAVSSSAGTIELMVTPGASGLTSSLRRDGEPFVAETRALDDVVGSSRPRLVKIDVEGAELDVLAGASRVLAEIRPVVVFEAPGLGGAQSTLDCVSQLVEYGYSVFSMWPSGLKPFDSTRHSHNLLAVHVDDAAVTKNLLKAAFPRNQNI